MLPHDELLHYGVRGMRWGVKGRVAGAEDRANRARGEKASATKIIDRAYDNKIIKRQRAAEEAKALADAEKSHRENKAQLAKDLKTMPKRDAKNKYWEKESKDEDAYLARVDAIAKKHQTSTEKKVNAIKSQIKEKRIQKLEKKMSKAVTKENTASGLKAYTNAFREGSRLNRLSSKAYDKGWAESMKASPTGARLRRSYLFSTTKEINDVNSRASRIAREDMQKKISKLSSNN